MPVVFRDGTTRTDVTIELYALFTTYTADMVNLGDESATNETPRKRVRK